jgi:hypothetical protein
VVGDDGIGDKNNNGDSQPLSVGQGSPSPSQPQDGPRGNHGAEEEQGTFRVDPFQKVLG